MSHLYALIPGVVLGTGMGVNWCYRFRRMPIDRMSATFRPLVLAIVLGAPVQAFFLLHGVIGAGQLAIQIPVTLVISVAAIVLGAVLGAVGRIGLFSLGWRLHLTE